LSFVIVKRDTSLPSFNFPKDVVFDFIINLFNSFDVKVQKCKKCRSKLVGTGGVL